MAFGSVNKIGGMMDLSLTLKFVESKLKQAESDVSIYSMLIQEIRAALEKNDVTTKNAKFLSIVANGKGASNEN
jgi:hypothetical protein